ncbi:conserved hypothetical protein [Beggiatoa sp. SS]|nr:conserved hypothetical protein [Beggiatoa sp. SS]
MTRHYFHFTLGPVQGFVAQARRTRDFWAGSFILSWLSAVAMSAVRAQEGKILFPKPDENFLAWLGDKTAQKSGDAPHQGNIPNRFKAEVNPDFEPLKIEESFELLNGEDHILSSDEECTLLATDYLNPRVNETRIKE